jgi:hypothetical protein
MNSDIHATPFTYAGKPHLLAIVRDITERVQAQQLLEQRVEERTRELSIESVPGQGTCIRVCILVM